MEPRARVSGGAGTYRGLDRIPAGRQAQAQIETLAVDRFDFPGPRIGAADAMAASKSGHARQRHGMRSPAETSEKIAPNLAAALHAHKGVGRQQYQQRCGSCRCDRGVHLVRRRRRRSGLRGLITAGGRVVGSRRRRSRSGSGSSRSGLRRGRPGIGRGAILLIGFERAQPRHVFLMLVVVFRKNVTAGAVGDEIELARARRIGGRFERGAAGIADRPRRQAVDLIGIVWRRLIDLAFHDRPPERAFAADQARK